MISKAGVIDENFGEREIGPLFNLSMITQVDEIYSTRHMNMHFIEFVEAIARVAEKVTMDKNRFKSPTNKGENSSIRNSSSTRK